MNNILGTAKNTAPWKKTMSKANFINQFLISVLFLGVTLACGGSKAETVETTGCGDNPFLKGLLNATENREFNELLINHGSVQQEELPCILKGVENSNDKKRLFAAQLLTIVRGDENVIFEAQKKVFLETGDILIWQQLMESFLYREIPALADLAAKRTDMIKKALRYTNRDDTQLQGKVQSTGLKAGSLTKVAGIDEEIKKRLDADDPELVSVALDALLPDAARAELPHLLQIEEAYEGSRKFPGGDNLVFSSLIDALIRTEDEKAFGVAQTALEKNLTNLKNTKGTREEFSIFRNRIVFIKAPYARKFCFYLIDRSSKLKPFAFDVLTTPVWADNVEPSKEVVQKCVGLIEKGNMATEPRKHLDDPTGQYDCERMFYFIETGKNPISSEGTVKVGADALPIGQKWLREH